MVGDGMNDGVSTVILPVERIGVGYSFRWKRNVEKRDGCGVLVENKQGLFQNKKQVVFWT